MCNPSLTHRQKYTTIHKTCAYEFNCIQILKLISADFGCLVVLQFFIVFIQRILRRWSPISNCTIRKHFLGFIATVILGISCWIMLCLNMLDNAVFQHVYRYKESIVMTDLWVTPLARKFQIFSATCLAGESSKRIRLLTCQSNKCTQFVWNSLFLNFL